MWLSEAFSLERLDQRRSLTVVLADLRHENREIGLTQAETP